MVTKSRVAGIAETAAVLCGSFALCYGVFMASGLVSAAPDTFFQSLHHRPPQIAFVVLALAALVRLVRRGPASALLFWCGIFLAAAGLLASGVLRFEGRILITEGQQISGAVQEYVEGSVLAGRWATVPRFALAAREVETVLSKDGRAAERIVLHAVYQPYGEPSREVTVGSRLPALLKGTLMQVTQFGYSPLFRIETNTGEVLDESFVSLAVFPPGMEDAIRPMQTPHTYYVRLEPQQDPERRDALDGLAFHLRVTRNLSLLFNGELHPRERVLIESTSVSFAQVRKWAEISVVRDPGLIVLGLGALLAAGGLLVGRGRLSGGRRGEHRLPGEATT